MPDASTRVPTLPRNAGGRLFETAAELNAYLTQLNAGGGVDGTLLPLVSDDARFSDSFSSLDLRVSKVFGVGGGRSLEALVEVFNLFNVTNILGVSTRNYAGYANVLARDSSDPASPGFLTSSSFGKAGDHGGRSVRLRRAARLPARGCGSSSDRAGNGPLAGPRAGRPA